MIRIFLVEDEILIREGIKNSIEWEKEGYQFVGEASDGELALPMILEEKPDILITDIRMPFMNGLKLSQLVKKELPDIKILILSGYDEFEYAKEAIKIGITEYLLKPISSAKLLEVLKEVSALIYQERENIPHGSFLELEQTHHVIEKFLNNGTTEDIKSFVEACFQEIPEDQFRSMMMRQYVIMNIYAVITSFCEKLQPEDNSSIREENEKTMKYAISTAESIEDIKAYMEKLLGQALEFRNTASGRRYSDIITNATGQIAQTYMSSDISLNSIAASVGMSPSYFSSIFSREMGKTFVEYLTEIRMEKAKELLACTSLKSSEIGYQIGYKDPHYFSYIFKKTLGCTPKEYRSNRKGEEK